MRLKILYVDDDAISLFVLRKYLENDFDVSTAGDTDQALKLVESHDFDVIILDQNLNEGNKNGKWLKQEMEKLQNFSNSSKFIAVTASIFEEDKETIIAHGFDELLIKPISKDQLIKNLEKATQQPGAM